MNKQFKKGDKVKNRWNKIETVLCQKNDCQVFTYENYPGWYHPTKLNKVN